MRRIYCAFSAELNQDSWNAGHIGHVVKIGQTGAGGKVKRIPSLNRGWRRHGEASAPLACKKDWIVVGLWNTEIASKRTLKKIEDEVRDCFVDTCGDFEMFEKLKAEMQAVHQNLNGLTEIVRIDLSRIDARGSFPSSHAWNYEQSFGLVESVLGVVRNMVVEWRKTVVLETSL